MLKLNQVIQIAPYAHLPKVWKDAVIIGDDGEYYYAWYQKKLSLKTFLLRFFGLGTIGTGMACFKFMREGYEDDWQVRE